MLIQVTKEDIESGIQGIAHSCPVALALRRITGDVWYVYPETTKIGGFMGRGELVNEVPVPKQVSSFALRFDDHKIVKPFSFRFTPPETNNVPN